MQGDVMAKCAPFWWLPGCSEKEPDITRNFIPGETSSRGPGQCAIRPANARRVVLFQRSSIFKFELAINQQSPPTPLVLHFTPLYPQTRQQVRTKSKNKKIAH